MKKGIRVALNMSSQVGSLCLAEKSGGGGDEDEGEWFSLGAGQP